MSGEECVMNGSEKLGQRISTMQLIQLKALPQQF